MVIEKKRRKIPETLYDHTKIIGERKTTKPPVFVSAEMAPVINILNDILIELKEIRKDLKRR